MKIGDTVIVTDKELPLLVGQTGVVKSLKTDTGIENIKIVSVRMKFSNEIIWFYSDQIQLFTLLNN